MTSLIRTTVAADGVLTATIDMPGRPMNVFSADLMDALDALMDQVDGDATVKSCVVTSGKPSFLAGADLVMVRGYCDAGRSASHEAMFEMCGRLGRQFVRLEASPKPWVAAVNGIALGGGLELALACRVRLVADDPRIQIGVPEVRWGLLPGAGGTQRLPRLTDFESAMDMLLTGRSIAPAEAVRLGVFARTVPAAQLLDEAKAVARALHGQPYNVTAKFARLAQTDVPAHSDATARGVAARHGVAHDVFDDYPAYSAIVDSVLKGARLPLAEATAEEMNQFLRLMFNPVAGRLVRTLFLERLRAERELAAPAGLRIERIGVGPITAARGAWRDALAKLKLPQATDDALPADTLELVTQQGTRHRAALRVLDEAPTAADGVPLAVLSPTGPYGRVLEIVGADDATADALAALGAGLQRSLPWRTPGLQSVLQRLRNGSLQDKVRTAVLGAAQAGAADPAFLDVAACMAGVAPAWCGGPLTWLWDEQHKLTPQFDATAQAAWTALKPRLQQSLA